ncbi:MAG: hypothetical protein J5563_06830 [Clostridia bacterium]|nr:hypothetical protein [Clostridia bacterium]
MKKIVKILTIVLALSLVSALTLVASAEDGYPDTIEIVFGTPSIDGKVGDGEWEGGTWMTLDAQTQRQWAWSAATDGRGYQNVQPAEDDQFKSEIKLMADEENLYIIERRTDDAYLIFADIAGQAFLYDGNGICIMKKGDVSSLRTISCLAEGVTTDKPVIDVQGQQNIDGVEAASTVTENGFVLEISVPWSVMSSNGLTLKDFASGNIQITYYVVNIFDAAYEEYVGLDSQIQSGWVKYSYQLQYPGVVSWEKSPVVKVTGAPDYITSEAETEPAPETVVTEPPAVDTADLVPTDNTGSEPVPVGSSDKTTDKAPATTGTTTDGTGSNTGLIIGICVAAVLVIAVVAAVIIASKKKK